MHPADSPTLATYPPTQQRALRDAIAAPLQRTRGGFRGASGVHTVRALNALRRNGILQATDAGQALLTAQAA
jgi:hypothetical protein